MAYITNTDIEVRLGHAAYVQLADDDGNGAADTGVVDEARLAAEGEVNSFLALRHATPIDVAVYSELADLLKSVSLDLAEYRLRLRRPPVSEDARRRREQTIEWLRRIGDGTVALPSLSAVPTTTARGTIAKAIGAERLLSRGELETH
jgi:phage gp36-like protein